MVWDDRMLSSLPAGTKLFSNDELDSLGGDLPIAITSVTAFLLVGWGLIATAAFSLPRTAYGLAALLGGVVLYRLALAFTQGARWALPVVAAVPPVDAFLVYRTFDPVFPMRSPFDLLIWVLVAVLALSDLTFLFGPVHRSWVADEMDPERRD